MILKFKDFTKMNESVNIGMLGRGSIVIPSFKGFHKTEWSEYRYDDLIDANEYETRFGHEPQYRHEWKTNWDEYKKAVGKFYTKQMQRYYSEVFGDTFRLSFDRIEAPRSYATGNDRLYADIDTKGSGEFVDKVLEVMEEHRRDVEKAIRRGHGSRDEILSKMSGDYDEWVARIRGGDTDYLGYAMHYAYCVSEFGGNENFWDGIDRDIFEFASRNGVTILNYTRPSTARAKDELSKYME